VTKHRQVNALPSGYTLIWYEIVKVIGKGGFGITYLARDKNLNLDVAIKEYLPEDFASRIDENTVQPKSEQQESLYTWGLKSFITEARTLAKFSHPNIVRVLSVFEHNGTAYMVMEYAHGEDLSAVYKKRDPFDEEKYLDIFIPIMDGLALIHSAGYIHRDIKPANIYICENDSPILLDFGSARQSVESQTRALTSLVTFGYAPFEQYSEGNSNKQGPWSDIFSLGASMYVGITGEKPVDALKRGGAILDKGIDPYKPVSVVAAGRFKHNFLLAIDNALMFKAEDRPQNILVWADLLLGKTVAPPLPDYMLQEAVDDEPETVILDKDNSAPSTTSPSKGSQGLVDAYGKRKSSVEQVSMQAGLYESPAHTPGQTRESKRLIIQLAIAATAVFAVIAVGIYIWQQPSDETTSKTSIVNQDDAAIDETTTRINDLLTQARQKQQQGQIFEPANNNAVYFYSQILKLDTDNAQAKKALTSIHQQLIDKTRDKIEQQKLTEAEQSLKLAEAIFPGHKQNIDLKLLLQQSSGNLQQVSQLLEKADAALINKQFTKPLNDNAYDYFKRVTELEPNNSAALKGLEQVENKLITLAESSIKSSKLDQAVTYLEQVDSINPNSEQAKKLRTQITQLTRVSSKLNTLLSTAETQYNNKKYSSPENDNAYDTYQQIIAIDPDNNKAKAGISNIKTYYKKRFDKNISASQLTRAQRDLDIMQRIASGEWITRRMQQTLAEKKRESQTPNKSETELISDLMGEFKTNLEKRDASKLKKISQFEPGRQRFVEQLMAQYKYMTVTISDFKYIAKNHQATANVRLSNLIDKNDHHVTPGAWSKFPIKIAKDSRQQYKVYW
jgi:serine/threonine protein kinase